MTKRNEIGPVLVVGGVLAVGVLAVGVLGLGGVLLYSRAQVVGVGVPIGLDDMQRASARVILAEAERAGLPPSIAAAMVVNAYAESLLNPSAYGDFTPSGVAEAVGLFQLHDRGAGRGMSYSDRIDPVVNTRRIIQELRSIGEGVLSAASDGASPAELSAMFSTQVERPRDTNKEEIRRRTLAFRLYPLAAGVSGRSLAYA